MPHRRLVSLGSPGTGWGEMGSVCRTGGGGSRRLGLWSDPSTGLTEFVPTHCKRLESPSEALAGCSLTWSFTFRCPSTFPSLPSKSRGDVATLSPQRFLSSLPKPVCAVPSWVSCVSLMTSPQGGFVARDVLTPLVNTQTGRPILDWGGGHENCPRQERVCLLAGPARTRLEV